MVCEKLFDRIDSLYEEHLDIWETVLNMESPPMERVDRNLELLETANRIFAENGLDTLKPVSGPGGSDAAQVTSYGIPCLDKIGVCGGYGHNPNEYAELESLKYSAKMLASFIYCV